MQSKDPYKLNEINFDNIVYGKIKENEKKKVIYIKYQQKTGLNKLVFQLPTLLYNNQIFQTNDYHEIELPIICKNTNNEYYILNFFKNLNSIIIDDAKMNSNQWFGDRNSSKYQDFIRLTNPNSKFKNGSIKLKVLKTPDFETILKLDNKRITVNDIPKLSWCKVLVEFYAIWINDNGFGGYLRPVLFFFKELQVNDYNYHLLDDSDEIDDVHEEESVFIKKEIIEDNEDNESTVLKLSLVDSINGNYLKDSLLKKNVLNLSDTSEDSLEEILSSETN